MKIDIIVADDHEIFRRSVASLLRNEPDFDVVAECANGRELLEQAARLAPAVVVMDIAMPELNGIDATRRLKQIAPATRIIMLSRHTDPAYVSISLSAGAVGYVVKSGAARDLLDAVRTASGGMKYLSEEISLEAANRRAFSSDGSKAFAELSRSFIYSGVERRQYTNETNSCLLTPREREVLQMVAEGRTAKRIAASLGISEETVKSHRKNIVAKLDIRDIAGLTRYAIRIGLTQP